MPDNYDSTVPQPVHPDRRKDEPKNQRADLVQTSEWQHVSWPRMALEITRAFGVLSFRGSKQLVIDSVPRPLSKSKLQVDLRIRLTTGDERFVLESKVVSPIEDGGNYGF